MSITQLAKELLEGKSLPSVSSVCVKWLKNEKGMAQMAYGITVPSDNTPGFEIGCLFQHTDGTDGSALYVNEGTAALCNFNLVTVAAA